MALMRSNGSPELSFARGLECVSREVSPIDVVLIAHLGGIPAMIPSPSPYQMRLFQLKSGSGCH